VSPGREGEVEGAGNPQLPQLSVGGHGAAQGPDPWVARARPAFLYVMYALLLWSVPLGLIAAVRPAAADAMVRAATAYLAGIPEPLYALFGTGYLGYTLAREWGKRSGR